MITNQSTYRILFISESNLNPSAEYFLFRRFVQLVLFSIKHTTQTNKQHTHVVTYETKHEHTCRKSEYKTKQSKKPAPKSPKKAPKSQKAAKKKPRRGEERTKRSRDEIVFSEAQRQRPQQQHCYNKLLAFCCCCIQTFLLTSVAPLFCCCCCCCATQESIPHPITLFFRPPSSYPLSEKTGDRRHHGRSVRGTTSCIRFRSTDRKEAR